MAGDGLNTPKHGDEGGKGKEKQFPERGAIPSKVGLVS